MLNKNLNVPVYAQLKELILGEIQSGALKAGDMIPTEHELMEQYSISRNAVRQAIGELVEGGYLIRKKAKGTFVSTPSANLEKISTLEPFRESALRTGAIPTTKVLSMEVLDADDCQSIGNRRGHEGHPNFAPALFRRYAGFSQRGCFAVFQVQLCAGASAADGQPASCAELPYIRDAAQLGMHKALIQTGHFNLEEPGMQYIAEKLAGLVPELPVQFIPSEDPYYFV